MFSHLSSLFETGSENGPSAQVASGQPGPVSGPGGAKAASRSQGPSDKEELGGIQKRARRQWESWSADDKNSFFEGLYEVEVFFSCRSHSVL